jgi:predicted nuclease of predicted toxin-antitoxin system
LKLLFDENLSPALVQRLADLFPGSLHVRDIGLRSADDSLVWDFAKQNDCLIVSKDADMHDLSLVFGIPPKVLWVRLGNCSTWEIEELLRLQFGAIELFNESNEVSLLALP